MRHIPSMMTTTFQAETSLRERRFQKRAKVFSEVSHILLLSSRPQAFVSPYTASTRHNPLTTTLFHSHPWFSNWFKLVPQTLQNRSHSLEQRINCQHARFFDLVEDQRTSRTRLAFFWPFPRFCNRRVGVRSHMFLCSRLSFVI